MFAQQYFLFHSLKNLSNIHTVLPNTPFYTKFTQHSHSIRLNKHNYNPWIWHENQWGGGGVLIGFSYIEIRFLNKKYSEIPKNKCYFLPEYLFFPVVFLFCSITDNTELQFYGLSMLSSIKCTSENTKYTQIFCAVWRYLY